MGAYKERAGFAAAVSRALFHRGARQPYPGYSVSCEGLWTILEIKFNPTGENEEQGLRERTPLSWTIFIETKKATGMEGGGEEEGGWGEQGEAEQERAGNGTEGRKKRERSRRMRWKRKKRKSGGRRESIY